MERKVCLLRKGKGNSQSANKQGKYAHIFYYHKFKEKRYAKGSEAGSENMLERHSR